MKVLLINNCHYRRGGADIVYLNTAEMLKKNGHDVVFFSIKDKKNLRTDDEKYFIDKKVEADAHIISKIKNLIYYFYNKQAAKNIERLIDIEKPDIAHIHLIYGGITPSILKILKRKNVPAVHSIHDYRLICPAYTFLNSKGEICEMCEKNSYYFCAKNKCSKGNFAESAIMSMEMYFRNIFFNASKYYSGIIYVSEFSKNKHLTFKPDLINVKSIVLYNYEQEYIKKGNVNKDKYYLYFGRISKEKGLLTLLSVFKELSGINLKIVGAGPQLKELTKFTRENNMLNIDFVGYKSGQELKEIIANAYFVIVPSEWYENNPLSIIESYALSTPVIVAQIGGIPEIIIDGETGYMFTPKNINELSTVLKNTDNLSDEKYSAMSLAAKHFADNNFNNEVYYNKLMSFYNRLL